MYEADGRDQLGECPRAKKKGIPQLSENFWDFQRNGFLKYPEHPNPETSIFRVFRPGNGTALRSRPESDLGRLLCAMFAGGGPTSLPPPLGAAQSQNISLTLSLSLSRALYLSLAHALPLPLPPSLSPSLPPSLPLSLSPGGNTAHLQSNIHLQAGIQPFRTLLYKSPNLRCSCTHHQI